MRHLDFRVVESGPCGNCGRDPGDHATNGLCSPSVTYHRHRDAPGQCYRGEQVYAFVDLDKPHTMEQDAAAAVLARTVQGRIKAKQQGAA